eukprot:4595022-Amphidinium_carterae.1
MDSGLLRSSTRRLFQLELLELAGAYLSMKCWLCRHRCGPLAPAPPNSCSLWSVSTRTLSRSIDASKSMSGTPPHNLCCMASMYASGDEQPARFAVEARYCLGARLQRAATSMRTCCTCDCVGVLPVTAFAKQAKKHESWKRRSGEYCILRMRRRCLAISKQADG